MKASYIVQEVLDERGRFISKEEFIWILSTFKDRYDPRRLALSIAFTLGLRIKDAVNARLKWFDKDFKELKMSQCKPSISKKDGVMHIKKKPRNIPLTSWLSTDLRNYCDYRLMVATFLEEDLIDFKLFPKLKRSAFDRYFRYLREEYPSKTWLKEVWMVVKRYDDRWNLIEKQNRYRVATHACRANYNTDIYLESNNDPLKASKAAGYSNFKDFEVYVRLAGILSLKQKVRDKYETLSGTQKIPLLVGQKNLKEF